MASTRFGVVEDVPFGPSWLQFVLAYSSGRGCPLMTSTVEHHTKIPTFSKLHTVSFLKTQVLQHDSKFGLWHSGPCSALLKGTRGCFYCRLLVPREGREGGRCHFFMS